MQRELSTELSAHPATPAGLPQLTHALRRRLLPDRLALFVDLEA